MAGELAHPRRGRDQDGAVRAALASLRGTAHRYDSPGIVGSHALLDGHRSGAEAPGVPALLQWLSRSCGAEGAYAGPEPGCGRCAGECLFVSLAVALSRALSDADGGVRVVRAAGTQATSK